MSEANWDAVSRRDPRALVEARLQLHYAAQVVAAVGVTLLEPRADDSHPNLGWRDGVAALAGHLVSEGKPFRAALRPADFSLLLLDGSDVIVDRRALAGATLDAAHDWITQAIEAHTGLRVSGGMQRAPYELPPHPIADGAPFADAEATAVIGSWFALAHTSVSRVAAAEAGASDVRCWPHHFDLATLISVKSDAGGALAKSVGVGWSPGDESSAEPYWYVAPWPGPKPDRLGSLGALGHWHTEGFTAAVLPASENLAASDPAAAADAFLASAVVACRGALGV